ncbi:hypothetical protein V6N13_050101 [Hibiscus sabdariffa]|uniref:Transmembrane protein n=1 Tax=Hibiscus sabdariffa TaxID=183260 RepID=A0ABR2QV96_9ROSI
MKNVSRNKFLLCFRPVVDMDLMLESKAAAVVNRPRNPYHALRYVDVGVETNEDSKPLSTIPNSDTRNSIMIRKKSFSQAIKAVFFETILAKRVRDRKNIDESENRVSPYSSWSSPPPPTPILMQESGEEHQQSDCNDGKLDEEGEMKKKQEGNDQGCSCSNNGIYFLLTCLAMTIFWGKLWAIIFSSSTWLYFLVKLLRQQQEEASGVDGNVETIKASPANGFERSREAEQRENIKFL